MLRSCYIQQLKEESGDLDWKVCNIQQVVEDYKCGFKKLEEEATLLECARAQVKALESESAWSRDRAAQ